MTRRRLIQALPALLLLVPLLGLTAGCRGGDDQTLIVYSPHGRDLLAALETAFEEEHPGIDVRWLDMGSQEVFDRIRSEKANPQADVWFGGPATIFSRGAEAGLLAPYRPEWADAVPADAQGPDDLYFGVYRTAPVLVYNANEVSEDDAPNDWNDLLAPRFEGEVIIRDPLASGTMRTMFGMILARSVQETGTPTRGFEWLRALDAQTREYVLNPALMIEKLIRGEGQVTVWELTDMLLQQQRGNPLRFRFPASGTPVIVDSIALVAGARHPEPARAWIDFVGSEEAQELAAREGLRLPARNDLPRQELPEWTGEVLDNLVPADVDWSLIAEHGDDWMRTWDREVRGQGAGDR